VRRIDASKPPALVIGSSANALSVVRSLGRLGVEMHVASSEGADAIRRSRFCTAFLPIGTTGSVSSQLLDCLDHVPGGAVVLPCDDHGLEFVARHRDEIVERGFLPIEADDNVLLAMLDKQRTYELARLAGVDTPATAAIRTLDDLEHALRSIAFPCALKPLQFHVFARLLGDSKKAYVVASASEAEAIVSTVVGLGLELLLTEIVPGADDALCSYYSYLDERGEPLLHFTKRKLRQHPNGFGLGCYQITDWNPEVAEVGLRFFQGIGLRGLAAVEFKRDARDGRLKLIECNHRFTAANEQVRIAGLDLARFTYLRLVGGELPPVAPYRSGVRLWHPLEDTRAFLSYRSRGELSLPGWIGSLLHVQHLPAFSWSDPLPTVVAHARRLRAVARRRRAAKQGPRLPDAVPAE